MNDIEVIRPLQRAGVYKAVLFDFDGTISLIREGWQGIMIPYFIEELMQTPGAEEESAIRQTVVQFVEKLTGKQTIYQCIELAEQIKRRGGTPKDPLEYKHEYHRRLWERIKSRVEALENKNADPRDMVVPGSHELLDALRQMGLTLILASGTDEHYVIHEARCLGVAEYFNGGIFGAQDQYRNFSKAMVIERIIRTQGLQGHELLGFGDGYVEIENVKAVGGTAIGVASDEARREGVDPWKRSRLIEAGADAIIPDYRRLNELLAFLFERRGSDAVSDV